MCLIYAKPLQNLYLQSNIYREAWKSSTVKFWNGVWPKDGFEQLNIPKPLWHSLEVRKQRSKTTVTFFSRTPFALIFKLINYSPCPQNPLEMRKISKMSRRVNFIFSLETQKLKRLLARTDSAPVLHCSLILANKQKRLCFEAIYKVSSWEGIWFTTVKG